MQDKVKQTLRFITIAIVSILITMIMLIFMFHIKSKLSNRVYFNYGWDISNNGTYTYDTSISEYHFSVALINDQFILQNTLPIFTEENITLTVPVDHSTISVYIDESEIYQYGKELYQKDIFVGSGYHWIDLPKDSSGKQITIKLTVTENHSFSNFGSIYYEPTHLVYHNFLRSQFPTLFTCFFLLAFGFLLLLISTLMLFYNRDAIRLVYISLFAILITLWFSCNYRLTQLISCNYSLNTTIEYISLYLAILPITLFFRDVYQDNKTQRRVFNGFVVFSFLFTILSFLLQAINFLHLSQTLYLFQTYLSLEVLFILYTACRDIGKKLKEDRIIFYGLLLLTTFAILDLLRFWTLKFAPDRLLLQCGSFMPIGVTLFVISMIYSYLYFIFRNLTTKTEHELLKKLAYSDVLTGIRNRAFMEKYMENTKIQEDYKKQDSVFAILNMDLNYLKTVNDTYGHEIGDNYLIRFAKLLSNCFAHHGEVGRIGGDEFLVVLPTTSKDHCEMLIANLEAMIARKRAFTIRPFEFFLWHLL